MKHMALKEPVAVASYMSVQEVRQKLELAVSATGHLRNLTSSEPFSRQPVLRGWISADRLAVTLFERSLGRNSFRPWFEGSLELAGDGTVLCGHIKLRRSSWIAIVWISGVALLAIPGMIAAAIVLIAQGRAGGIAVFCTSVVFASIYLGTIRLGVRSFRSESEDLRAALTHLAESSDH